MSSPSTERTPGDELGAGFVAAPGAVVAERYELLTLLGRGAAGSVWEAKHRVLASRVALKLLDAHLGRSEAEAAELLARFRFEAQLSARLGATVRNVIAVHDAGAHEGLPFLAMELVRGESLEDRLCRGSFDRGELAHVVSDVAEALDGLHAKGIAHRDLKPANVLCVEGEGSSSRTTYKLADFGVAKMFGEALPELVQPKQTATNMLVGTPAYMSPGYLAGGGSVDGSGDLWALAVMAYELYTGRLPFDGANWTAVAVAITAGDFEPPSKVLGRRTPSLDGFFARALAQRPEHRFGSGAQLARALVEALQSDAALGAAPPSSSGAREPAPLEAPSALREPLAGPPRDEVQERSLEAPKPKRRRRLVPFVLVASSAVLVVIGLGLHARMDAASTEPGPSSPASAVSEPVEQPQIEAPRASGPEPPPLAEARPAEPADPTAPSEPTRPRRAPTSAAVPPAAVEPSSASPVASESPVEATATPAAKQRPTRALPKEEVF